MNFGHQSRTQSPYGTRATPVAQRSGAAGFFEPDAAPNKRTVL
jgi:hypothetical protein